MPELPRSPHQWVSNFTHCQQFIDKTVRRIKDLDRSREVESVRVQDGLQRLQQEAAARVSVPHRVDSDRIDGEQCGGVIVWNLKVLNWRWCTQDTGERSWSWRDVARRTSIVASSPQETGCSRFRPTRSHWSMALPEKSRAGCWSGVCGRGPR